MKNTQNGQAAILVVAADSATRARVADWAGGFSREGWITRDGTFLPCDFEMGHPGVALCALGGKDAESAETEAAIKLL